MECPNGDTVREIRIVKIAIVAVGKQIFDDSATNIEIVDETGGEFIEISQETNDVGKIRLDTDEWPAFRSAVDFIVSQCREIKKEE